MENAAKALLIASGVLIAILLLTLFAYLMRQMGSSSASIYSTLSQHDITEFNQRFLNYEGRDDLSIHDVITIVNLAKDNNKRAKNPIKIVVSVNNDYSWVNKSQVALSNIIKNNLNSLYECKNGNIIIDNTTRLVRQVKINTK